MGKKLEDQADTRRVLAAGTREISAMSFRKGTDTIPKLVGGIMSGIIPSKRTPRTMKYPYTLTAKIAHFPYAHYWKNNWLYRYMWYATVVCIPVFYKIQQMCKCCVLYLCVCCVFQSSTRYSRCRTRRATSRFGMKRGGRS
ncbi:hypothetical protein FHG87_012804 [Trinorchestia longiramus]|nr:hypothetical protein FHG87_012804 [Trinorchestia longiramus]